MKPSLNCPSVWIVDDDEDDQLIIQSAFGDLDLSVEVLLLNDGTELLPKLYECAELPRLILLDVNMPRQNGFETLKEIRNVPDFADLPIVMLTTSTDSEDREQSLSLGATHFLTKPLTYPLLRELAQELSEQWQLT